MKLKDVSTKKEKGSTKDKMPIIECDGALSKTIDEIVGFKTEINNLNGQIALRRPEIDTKGLDAIVEQIVKQGSFENIKLVSKSGKAVNFSLIDGYKKIDQEQIKAVTDRLGSIIGAKNVDEYIKEVNTYSIDDSALTIKGAEDALVAFSNKFEKEFGVSPFNCTTETKVLKGSVKKLNKFGSKKEIIMDLIDVLQITKQMK